MLLAHKIQLYPTKEQENYFEKCFGMKRHCFNHLLSHFSQEGIKWSKKEAHKIYQGLRMQFPWYVEVSSRITREAVTDLDNAFKHFFRRVKSGEKPGFPKFKKKGINECFAIREKELFKVNGRKLRLSRMPSEIKMQQQLRFSGVAKQVTVSKRANKYYASILVETSDYQKKCGTGSVGVDLGIHSLAVLSSGTEFPANQNLKKGLKKLKKLQQNLSKKVKGSNRRAKAKQRVARHHARITNQRIATIHGLTDFLTKTFNTICIEDLNVKGMVKNHRLSRSIIDAGLGLFRAQLKYKADLRGCKLKVINRFYPSSKTCSQCGEIKPMPLNVREYNCECGLRLSRDLNAAINILKYGEDMSTPTITKRTQEQSKTGRPASVLTA